MQLVELTQLSGEPITVNPVDVSSVVQTDHGSTYLNLRSQPGEAYEVRESRRKATMLLNMGLNDANDPANKVTPLPQPQQQTDQQEE